MEITRQFRSPLSFQSESVATVKNEPSIPVEAKAPIASVKSELKQIQNELSRLSDVDLDRVAALKSALARGELSSDGAVLAGYMLSYHHGNTQ